MGRGAKSHAAGFQGLLRPLIISRYRLILPMTTGWAAPVTEGILLKLT